MPTYDLGLEHVSLAFATKNIFTDVTQGVFEGDRIGIVGKNGDGKSTLLHLFKGTQEPDSGRVTMRNGLTFGMLDQRDPLDDNATVREAALEGREDYEWAAETKSREIVEALLGGISLDAKIGSLSGGQRRRADLARLLLKDWDILALDEPTNHLDVVTIHWLAEHLKNRWPSGQGALLLVTHDRWFLDEVCESMWEVHDGRVDPFEGGYSAYILQRVERDRQSAVIEQRRKNLATKELAWLRRGAPARTAKPKFRIEAANALIEDVPEIRDKVSLQSLAVTRLGKDVVDLLDAGVAYDGRDVLQDVEWRIAPGERTGILGVNGAGKSTLLGLVAGTVEPTSGRVKRGKTVKVATLTQRMDELDEHLNDPVRVVISGLRTSYTIGTGAKAAELTPGQLLERMGFSSAQLSTPVKDLSGGQQRRLQLLLILLDQPNVLILDEPTNDLDTDMLSAIEDLLDSWAGTLLVVSHDRYFLERVTDQQYAVLGGRLRHLPGGIDEYLRLREHERVVSAATGAQAGSAAQGGPGAQASAVPALAGADLRAAQKELAAAERRIEKLTAQADAARTALAEHDQADYVGLGEKMAKIGELDAEVAALEERWFALTDLIG